MYLLDLMVEVEGILNINLVQCADLIANLPAGCYIRASFLKHNTLQFSPCSIERKTCLEAHEGHKQNGVVVVTLDLVTS